MTKPIVTTAAASMHSVINWRMRLRGRALIVRTAIQARGIVADVAVDRDHEVQALAAGGLRPTVQAFVLQQFAQPERALDDELPRNGWAGIEVEHQQVGMFDVVDGRRPRMHFHNVHLDQTEQSGDAVDPHPHAFAAFALLNPAPRRPRRRAF